MSYPRVPRYRCVLVRDGAGLRAPPRRLSSDDKAAALIRELTDDSPVERLVCLYLDSAHNFIGSEIVGSGWENGVMTTMTTVFRGAVIHGAHAIILGHNHPSDDPTPTTADVDMTAAAQLASKVLGIALIDHIVVSHSNGHRSMRLECGEHW